MDFKKVEICNPATVNIVRFSAVDAIDPVWDADNDIVMSRNGAVLIFTKPIEDYRWIEIDFVNLGNPIINWNMVILRENQGDTNLEPKSIVSVPALVGYESRTIKFPNIGRIEKLYVTAQTWIAGNYAAIKSIRVVQNDQSYQLAKSSAIAAVIGVGWTYDATNDYYYYDIAAGGGAPAIQLNAAFLKPADNIWFRFWTYGPHAFQLPGLNLEGNVNNLIAQDFSMDVSGDTLKQTWPINLNALGGFGGERIYFQYKYGSFPTGMPSAFITTASNVAIPPAPVVPAGILGSNNIWNGSNTFNGAVVLNGSLSFGVISGYLKASFGVVSVVAGVAVADITGAGDILTHNVAEFFRVANNLSEGVPATMRANLGLGTAALQPIGTFLQVANNLSDVGNVATARTNLGLGSAALLSSAALLQAANNLSDVAAPGTARTNLGLGTVATHNHAEYLLVANNLSDVVAATARANLGLGTVATHAFAEFMASANNLSDVANVATSRTNLGLGTLATQNSNNVTVTGGTIDGAVVGGVTPAAGTFTTLTATNTGYFQKDLGVGSAATPIASLAAMFAISGIHQSTGADTRAIEINETAPTTNTGIFVGVQVDLVSQNLVHGISASDFFRASGFTRGASSTVTTIRGFYASNAIAKGTSNYGFYSDINAASSTYQFYAVGTAQSFFGGEVGIISTASTDRSLAIGKPSSTATGLFGIVQSWITPATATGATTAYYSDIGTAASAFTSAAVIHFSASNVTKGAGSTITEVYGFSASNNIAKGNTNYGFYSNINDAANTYAFYGAGTAGSAFGGAVGMGGVNPAGATITLRVNSSPLFTNANPELIRLEGGVPATSTAGAFGIASRFSTQNSAFACNHLSHFVALGSAKGAASTITTTSGFWASNNLTLVGASNAYGYYSDIGAAANTWQLYLSGGGNSYIAGPVSIGSNNDPGTALVRLNFNSHPNTAASIAGISFDNTAPATATVLWTGYNSILRTAAAAFTCAVVEHFRADQCILGAGSAITSVYGFRVRNNIAVGGSNYGFYSDVNAATNTWQMYMTGTAPSYHASPMNFLISSTATDAVVRIGADSLHPGTSTTIYGYKIDARAPSTATNSFVGNDSILRTQAAAFTLTNMVHFRATSGTVGAGSSVTSAVAFWAMNAAMVGATNNYGYYSDINSGTGTFQFLGLGTAPSRFDGQVGFGATPGLGYIHIQSTHPNTGGTIYGIMCDIVYPATATGNLYNNRSVMRTAAASFTASVMTHFLAENTIKGAGSTINNIYGFYAANAIATAAGTSATGFYSDIAAGSGIRQMNMSGTADSQFSGALVMNIAPIVEYLLGVTYSASMTINAASGNNHQISPTDGVAFTLNAPSNPRPGQHLRIIIRNISGGVLGAATWNAVFKMTAWVQPANGFSRSIEFIYTGSNWIEIDRTAADVPN